jgi:hypothetical protein
VNKSRLVNWPPAGERTDRFILFSRSGFTKGMRQAAKKEPVLLVKGETSVSLPVYL